MQAEANWAAGTALQLEEAWTGVDMYNALVELPAGALVQFHGLGVTSETRHHHGVPATSARYNQELHVSVVNSLGFTQFFWVDRSAVHRAPAPAASACSTGHPTNPFVVRL